MELILASVFVFVFSWPIDTERQNLESDLEGNWEEKESRVHHDTRIQQVTGNWENGKMGKWEK